MTEILNMAWLVVAAFGLGACPFSVWVGRWFLDKDIRDYGDGNPGATNVFRAGDVRTGMIALTLDIAKGFPFVFVSYAVFGFSEVVAMSIGISAILGHAFSPLLHLKGGKAVATTFGVLLALPQRELLLIFIVFILLAFLFIEPDAWTTLLAPAGSLAYLVVARGYSWESLFMVSVLAIFTLKQYDGLRTFPRFRIKLIRWYQSRS